MLSLRRGDVDAVSRAVTNTLQRSSSYLETWLRFIGISNIATVTVEKTLFGPEVDGAARAAAKAYAAEAVLRCADLVNEEAALRQTTPQLISATS